MAFYLATVLIGTIYPIFTEVLSGHKISVGPPFYNIVIGPMVIPLLMLMALAPQAKWIKNRYRKSIKAITIFLIAILFNFFIFNYFKSYSILSNLIITSSIFLIIYSITDLIKNISHFDFSRTLSHLGFGLLIFFIGISHNFSIESDFNLRVGEKKNFSNYLISFNKLELEERKNHKAVKGYFDILNLQNLKKDNLVPEIRIYNQPETLTYEASIKSKLFYDVYLTMSNVNRSDFYNIKFQKKPFMIWIWISAALIALGGFVRIFKNEN